MDSAFDYAADEDITTEDNYPYVSGDTKTRNTCSYAGDGIVGSNGYTDITTQDPKDLIAALNKQPVAIAIEADQIAFQLYSSGVLAESKCGTTLDHGVLVVGYGTENGVDYWKVKNSWGPTWGRDGYIYLERTAAVGPQTCGILSEPSYPAVNAK